MVTVSLPADLTDVVRHLEAAYPNEGCGVIVRERDGAFTVVPMKNDYDQLHARWPDRYPRTARTAYEFDSKEQRRVFQAADERGATIHCVFHSHCDAGAYFSEEDRRAAAPDGFPLWPGVCYLVVAVDQGRASAARVFWWDAGDFREAEVPLRP